MSTGGAKGRQLIWTRIAIATSLALVLVTAVAFGGPAQPVLDQLKQTQDVGPFSCQQTQNQACVDTEATPVAKDGKAFGWSQVAGAVFPASGDGTLNAGATLQVKQTADLSPVVPTDVDFFAPAA